MTGSLDGCRVVVTRERPGELGAMLARRGALVVHVPLIEVVEPADGARELSDALADLDDYDWLILTSAAVAERVGAAVRSATGVRLAVVGAATAQALARQSGRRVDLVPDVQRADALAERFVAESPPDQSILILQADIAASSLAETLRLAGHRVTTVTAYRTVAREPANDAGLDADAVLFASGSSVESWCRAFGPTGPPLRVAIGPSTAAVARRLGLKLSGVASDHSVKGLVTELERLRSDPAATATGRSPRRN